MTEPANKSARSGGARYRVSADIVANRVADVMVLVNLKTDRIFSLNKTASRLWELLASGNNLDEVRANLLDEFDVPANQVDREIDEMISSFKNENLITSEE